MSDALARLVLLPLLDVANDDPPTLERRAFYDLKRRLLARYATPDGVDVQYIEDECYGCDGRGCGRCTNGVYRTRFNELKRWRWGVHSFHTWERQIPAPPTVPQIKGRVQHRRPRRGHISAEAWYWLALLCDRPAFWRSWGHTGHLGKRYTPLVVLGTLRYQLRWALHRARARWQRFRDRDELPF